ncbi:hypothetical protein [Clostridium perfringens]|uniref:hypothetical protein n=1 Tax=Clostridium perfringens TaxID=1502 RepID=UPI000AC19C4F|nr:hypothetical protein [Clostridium perfringens]
MQQKIRPYFIKDFCEECGVREGLELHHSDKFFITLLEETLVLLGLEGKNNTEDYTEKN